MNTEEITLWIKKNYTDIDNAVKTNIDSEAKIHPAFIRFMLTHPWMQKTKYISKRSLIWEAAAERIVPSILDYEKFDISDINSVHEIVIKEIFLSLNGSDKDWKSEFCLQMEEKYKTWLKEIKILKNWNGSNIKRRIFEDSLWG